MADFTDYYVPKSHIKTFAGLTDLEFLKVLKESPACGGNEDGFPICQFILHYNTKAKELEKAEKETKKEYEKAFSKLTASKDREIKSLGTQLVTANKIISNSKLEIERIRIKAAAKVTRVENEFRDYKVRDRKETLIEAQKTKQDLTYERQIEIQRMKDEAKKRSPEEAELEKLTAEMNRNLTNERITQLKIANNMKAGLLVAKVDAESRMIKLLNALSALVKSVIIPNAAEELGQTNYQGKVRLIVEILTKNYNKGTDLLSEAQNISWENDMDSDVLKSRLHAIAEVDPNFKDSFNDLLYKENVK